jgi:hypothetical protein
MAADEPSAPCDEYRHSVAPFDKLPFQRAAFCGGAHATTFELHSKLQERENSRSEHSERQRGKSVSEMSICILHPAADYRERVELCADPYFKISIRSLASSRPPACARDKDRGLS